MINAKMFTKSGNLVSREREIIELQANYILCTEDNVWVHKSKQSEIIYVNGLPFCLSRHSNNFDLVLTVMGDYQLKRNCHTIITRGQPKFISKSISLEDVRQDTIFSVSMRDQLIFLDNDVARNNKYMFCQTCHDYTKHEESSVCTCCGDYRGRATGIPVHNTENNHTLFRYHNAKRVNLIGDEIFGIGFEVEKEDLSFSLNCHQLRSETGWVAETDSSLDSQSGFELISPALPFNTSISIYDQLDWISQYIKPVEVYLGSSGSEACGGHIHISQKNTAPQELLDSISGYLPLFYALYPERLRSSYSYAYKKDDYKSGGRRMSFHCSPKGTLEIRIFPLVEDMDDLLWRSELLRLVLKNQTPNYKEAFNLAFVEDSELSRHLESVFGKKSLLSLSKLFSKFAKEIDGLVVDQAELEKAMVKFK